MTTKKACLIFVPNQAALAQTIQTWLHEDAFDVCAVEIALTHVALIKAGDYAQDEAVRACVKDANLCIFLLGASITDAVLSASAEVASSNNRVVVVTVPTTVLPQVFDDTADAVVSATSTELRAVIQGKNVWQKPDGHPTERRVPARVKCQ
jgi:hypothetical protein